MVIVVGGPDAVAVVHGEPIQGATLADGLAESGVRLSTLPISVAILLA
jgi:hypothetical protein